MTDATSKLRGFAAWRQRRRLRKAARLLKRKVISDLDYAVIASDVVTRFQLGRPVTAGDNLSLITYGAHGLLAVGVPVKDWETEMDRQYGPLTDAPHTLGDHFHAYGTDGDSIDQHPTDFVWGAKSSDLLWRADMRLRRRYRLIERYNQWKRRQKEFAPAAHEDLWRALIGVLAFASGYLLRVLTAP